MPLHGTIVLSILQDWALGGVGGGSLEEALQGHESPCSPCHLSADYFLRVGQGRQFGCKDYARAFIV